MIETETSQLWARLLPGLSRVLSDISDLNLRPGWQITQQRMGVLLTQVDGLVMRHNKESSSRLVNRSR